MVKRILELLAGIVVGIASALILQALYYANIEHLSQYVPYYVPTVSGIIIGIVFFFVFAPLISGAILGKMDRVEAKLSSMSLKELLACITGMISGLVIANLIGIPISKYGTIGSCIVVALNLVFGYLGYRVARRKKDEIPFDGMVPNTKFSKSITYGKPKILDTSVIIDGRILDLLKTGFIEGKIIIPNFVLEELRHIADSSDSLKRNRGRRGLDILNEIQKQLAVSVEIVDFNCKEQLEVDSMLLKMAQKMDAFVVTNDYNLNKVAEFQGVMVLNINELSNAIKPVVLPGEEMTVTVIKSGKENGQGIAYLNDGTMIVIDGGNKFIGETINVVVTSVLQTAAGRMIFGRKKD